MPTSLHSAPATGETGESSLPTVFSPQDPAIDRRGVHLDLKGLPPTFDRLMELIEVFGEMRFNMLVVEWEDMFPWTFDTALRHPAHYTPEQVRLLADRCAELGIEVIPLIQCLGHLEFILQHEAYQHLAECPEFADTLNPMLEESVELVLHMVNDVLALMPNVQHFHLGGDEAWSFGSSPESQGYIAEHGKPSLYLKHVQPILNSLRSREVRPLLWHDMMMDWPVSALRDIGEDADLVVWGYRGTPAMRTHHHRVEVLDRLREAGIPIWGASAYKGADGPFRDLPDKQARLLNHLGWIDAAEPYALKGLIATGWSRYASGRVQVESIDACLTELAMASLVFHNGRWPDDGWETCDRLLLEAGESDGPDQLREHFQSADALREEAWLVVRQIKEQLAGMQVDPGKPSAGTNRLLWECLQDRVKRVEDQSTELPKLLEGLVCEPFIEPYCRTWATALRNECDSIKACLKI